MNPAKYGLTILVVVALALSVATRSEAQFVPTTSVRVSAAALIPHEEGGGVYPEPLLWQWQHVAGSGPSIRFSSPLESTTLIEFQGPGDYVVELTVSHGWRSGLSPVRLNGVVTVLPALEGAEVSWPPEILWDLEQPITVREGNMVEP